MQKRCFPLGCLCKDAMSLQVGAILQGKLLTLAGKEKRRRGWGWGPESTGHCGGRCQEEHCDMIQKSFIKCEDRIQARLCYWQAEASQAFQFMFLDSVFSSVKRVLLEMTAQVPFSYETLWLLQGLFSLCLWNNKGPGLEKDLTALRHKRNVSKSFAEKGPVSLIDKQTTPKCKWGDGAKNEE